MWIDTHCHLDAPEFDADRGAVLARARTAGVRGLVIPAVAAAHFDAVRALAHAHGAAYALGLHPLWLAQADESDLATLREHLQRHRDDPQLVAVGEIGLDHFVPAQSLPGEDAAAAQARVRQRQMHFYVAQLKLARDAGLPVILHVRRSADALLQGLRRVPVVGGIAHAFNGSLAQAQRFVALGFRLGFGGAMTFERALQIRALAANLPAQALVLETDAPDIPPHWLYRRAADRAAGSGQAGVTHPAPPATSAGQGRNEPAELPRIAQTLAALRGWDLATTAALTAANARAALPRLAALPAFTESGTRLPVDVAT